MASTRRYRNGKFQHHKVFVITDEADLTIDILLMRGPTWKDEHSMQFRTIDEYRNVEYDIFSTLRDKGFIYYDEQ